jgi:hypothetical protein
MKKGMKKAAGFFMCATTSILVVFFTPGLIGAEEAAINSTGVILAANQQAGASNTPESVTNANEVAEQTA